MQRADALAFARRARTMAAQIFQREDAFVAIVPSYGEEFIDLLQVRWMHGGQSAINGGL
jgi:hypothetical protein